ncbi:MAG: FAD-dependent oxidoreductase [Caldimonas sp.]
MKAIIAGGGIGGLATAAALVQRGWDVTVYESNPTLRVSGSGIYLWSNGLKVLKDVGAFDRVCRDPFWSKGVENRGRNNEMLAPAGLPPGLEIICVARSHLLEGLEEAARRSGVRIVTSAPVVSASPNGSFKFANSNTVEADLAIGCDGTSSPVRRALGLERLFMRSDEGALRVIVKATQDDMPPDMRGRCFENWNGRRRLLVTPISSTEVFLAMTCPEADVEARDPAIRDCWREAFPTWRFLLDRIPEGSGVLWNTYTTIVCEGWSAGRTCIVGDAAHAQLPNIGQGGGMALQNGLGLAAYMAKVTDRRDIPDALVAWEAETRPLTDLCQYWSGMWGNLRDVPDDIRAGIFHSMGQSEWLGGMITAPAAAEPIAHTSWSPTPVSGA